MALSCVWLSNERSCEVYECEWCVGPCRAGKPVAAYSQLTASLHMASLFPFSPSPSAQRVRLAFNCDDIRGDDIAISGMLANGERGRHRLLRCFAGRIKELPAPHALVSNGNLHYERRENVRRRFFPSLGDGVGGSIGGDVGDGIGNA